MKKMLLAACVAIALPVAAQAETLVTALGPSNGNDGIMFDVVAGANAVTIQSLASIISSTGVGNYEFYTIAGGIGGNQSNAAAWTLNSSFSDVATTGGMLSVFDVTDFQIAAGATVGFYITTDNITSPAIRYSNSVGPVGSLWASDANLSILTGFGKIYPFGNSAVGRDFNGSITYALNAATAVPEPATWAMLLVGIGVVGGSLRRARRTTATVQFA